MYKGIYGVRGQLLAAESGTFTEPERVEALLGEQRASDRDQSSNLKDRTPEDSGSTSAFLVSEAERIIAADVDQEGVTEKSGVKSDRFLDLMSSLVDKIDKLESRIADRDWDDTTIHHGQSKQQRSDRPDNQYPGILHPSTRTLTVEGGAISSVARKHEAATKDVRGDRTTKLATEKAFDIMEEFFPRTASRKG